MKIALLTPGFSQHADDWAIPALLTLARELARRYQLHIFSQRYPARGLYRFAGLTHHALGGGQHFGPASVRIWLETTLMVIRQHRRTPFDLLHAFWADEAGLAAVIAGALIRRPVVVSLGGGELTRLPRWQYGAQRFLARRLTTHLALRRADLVTAGSAYQLDLCRTHGVDEARLRFAPLGVDTNRFRPAPFRPASPTLIQVASLTLVKNQSLLMQVLGRIVEKIPAVRLFLVGDGPEANALRQQARKLGVEKNIIIRGTIPHPQMPEMYRQAHLYVQTSRHESQGMAALEAMACGLPVVGTPVGVLREVASAPAHTNPNILAGQIVPLLVDPAQSEALGRQARQIVVKQFDLPVCLNRFSQIYEEVRQ